MGLDAFIKEGDGQCQGKEAKEGHISQNEVKGDIIRFFIKEQVK